MKKLCPQFKVWLGTKGSKGILGEGRWRLLKAIEARSSLIAACKLLKISYRKAWGDLNRMQEALNVTLVNKERGGKMGGQTTLTEAGKKLLSAYSNFHNNVEKSVNRAYEKHFEKL
jgi:molybdate transport repressor ModE-like protein